MVTEPKFTVGIKKLFFFRMADPRWWTQIVDKMLKLQKMKIFTWYFLLGGFRGLWLLVRSQTQKIIFLKMANPRWRLPVVDKNVKIAKNEDFYLVFFTRGFSGLLITNLQAKSKNSLFQAGVPQKPPSNFLNIKKLHFTFLSNFWLIYGQPYWIRHIVYENFQILTSDSWSAIPKSPE